MAIVISDRGNILATYSPNLNLIEGYWRCLKKEGD